MPSNFPAPQGLNSRTFKPGPIDGSLNVIQLLDLQYKQSPDHPVFLYDREDGGMDSISFSQYVPTVHEAAKLVAKDLRDAHLLHDVLINNPLIVGILALTGL